MMWAVMLVLVSGVVRVVRPDVVALAGEEDVGAPPCVRVCSGTTGQLLGSKLSILILAWNQKRVGNVGLIH